MVMEMNVLYSIILLEEKKSSPCYCTLTRVVIVCEPLELLSILYYLFIDDSVPHAFLYQIHPHSSSVSLSSSNPVSLLPLIKIVKVYLSFARKTNDVSSSSNYMPVSLGLA